ncbi:MAG TPA: hypothetical protein VKE22_19245 [Haliangiales bacterium]|nr:hypothetical protein [Haliangiales bacterium]
MRKLVVSAVLVVAAGVIGIVLGAAPARAESWRVHVGGGGGYHAAPSVHVSAPHVYSSPAPRAVVVPQGRVVVHDYRFRGGGVWVPPVRVWQPSWYYRYWWPYRRPWGYWDWGYYGYYGYYPGAACCAYERVGYAAGPAEPYDPRFGLGIRGSGTSFGKDQPHSEGLGGLLRIRVSSVELELEILRDHYPDLTRNDTRVGASLVVPLFGTVLQPYVIGGAGVNFVDFDDGSTHRTQGFLAGGGGLALNIGRGFTLAADVRYMVRHFFDSASSSTTPVVYSASTAPPGTTTSDTKREAGVEGRVSAIFYF